MSPADFLAAIADAEEKQAIAKSAWNAIAAQLKETLNRALPSGTVVDLRFERGRLLPDHLMTLKTIAGNDRGTKVFRIERICGVEINTTHPGLTKWVCEATPISEKTGRDMSAKVAKSVRSNTGLVTLEGRFTCSHGPEEPTSVMMERFAKFVSHPELKQ